jgi:hypothetical protein
MGADLGKFRHALASRSIRRELRLARRHYWKVTKTVSISPATSGTGMF